MSESKYWQSFGELNDPEFKKKAEDEFTEDLPFEAFDDKGLMDAKAPRRDFLKYLGFSTAAATIAASCKIPVKKAVPYANKPADLVPGVPKYYATTYVQDGDAIPAIAKVRDGRPIKIEGNDLSYTGGGTTARMQASVLDLYDMYRVRFPMHRVAVTGEAGKFKYEEVPTFEQLDKMIGDAMKTATGAVVLLSSTITSPVTKEIISKFPNLRHVQYDGFSYSAMLEANEAAGHGRKLPTYKFDAAKVIVSLGADFLGTWLDVVENSKGYGVGRVIDEKNPQMNKHYHFEGHLSMTGSNADDELPGIGAYTAAAVAAIAFDQPVVPVDGNVERVVARLFAVEEPLPGARPRLAALAGGFMADPQARARPGDFAQALFDLGATICTPRAPACALCPWRGDCAAQRAGIQAELPRKSPKAARPLRHGTHFLVTDAAGQVLLRRRPPRGLLGGMLEIPGTPWRDLPWEGAEAAAHAPLPGLAWRRLPGVARHGFTHFELEMALFAAEVPSLDVPPAGMEARPMAEAPAALPTVMRRLLALAGAERAALEAG
jgi:MoCo/4Fe-4S cofactor protein with predicted Tat translocation signal